MSMPHVKPAALAAAGEIENPECSLRLLLLFCGLQLPHL
jgi:hypothetical protein